MTCDCISYNLPEPWQKIRNVLLDWGLYFLSPEEQEERKALGGRAGDTTVLVDACIVPAVLHLWENGVSTANSCCGHGDPERRGIILSEHKDLSRAVALMAAFDPTVRIGAWVLEWSVAQTEVTP